MAKFTAALSTPGAAFSAFSTLPTHDAQTMPPTAVEPLQYSSNPLSPAFGDGSQIESNRGLSRSLENPLWALDQPLRLCSHSLIQLVFEQSMDTERVIVDKAARFRD